MPLGHIVDGVLVSWPFW